MTDASTIRSICAKLDPANDGHWTSQGLPRMDVLAGMGLEVERRALNEAVPGFNRTKAAESRAQAAEVAGTQLPVATQREPAPTHAQLCHKQLMRRAERRQAALQHLAAGGFTLKDLEPLRSRLDQRLGAQNRAARRELGN